LVTGLRKRDAEELLDWLEAHGYPHLLLTVGEEESFAVGWAADRGGGVRECGGPGPARLDVGTEHFG
jgi:hypothetical protein